MLGLLNERLASDGVTGEICIVEGAAMILAFGSRESTKDIDALMVAPASVRSAAATVAAQEGLPSGWLNDGAKGFASGNQTEVSELLTFTHLRVVMPPLEYILAMKCMAARVGLDVADKDDAKFLIRRLGLRGPDEVLAIVQKYYPPPRIPAKTSFFVQEIFDELAA